MTKGHEPICMHCKHLKPRKPGDDFWSCDAYPKGIPDMVIEGWVVHNEPFKDDNGIQFEAKEN